MTGRRIVLLLLLSSAMACSGPENGPETAPVLRLGEVLGGDDTAGYLRAETPRAFSFPQDHGPHPGFRNEWWYLTGNLADDRGRRFGYQVTFFSAARPPATGAVLDSGWAGERIWMAHVALSDVEAGEHRAFERFSRENPGLAGASAEPFRVWLEDWQLAASGNTGFPWQLDVTAENLRLELSLQSLKAPVLQGDAGLSRKSQEPGNASYYYSLSRIATSGSIGIDGRVFRVEGLSWLDREWSTSALAPDQSGWDWFSLQFDDGQELMYYQLRTTDDQAHPDSRGNHTDHEARQTPIRPEEITLTELAHWISPAGIRYTTAWRMAWRDDIREIRALFDAQWMNVSIPYWEGAVEVLDERGNRVGHGYLEMVR